MASGGRAVQITFHSRNSLSYLRASAVSPDQGETRGTVCLYIRPLGGTDLVVTIAHAFQTEMIGGLRHDFIDLDVRHPETPPFESALLLLRNLLVKKLDKSPAPPP